MYKWQEAFPQSCLCQDWVQLFSLWTVGTCAFPVSLSNYTVGWQILCMGQYLHKDENVEWALQTGIGAFCSPELPHYSSHCSQWTTVAFFLANSPRSCVTFSNENPERIKSCSRAFSLHCSVYMKTQTRCSRFAKAPNDKGSSSASSEETR